jgi:hypothetical protein
MIKPGAIKNTNIKNNKYSGFSVMIAVAILPKNSVRKTNNIK